MLPSRFRRPHHTSQQKHREIKAEQVLTRLLGCPLQFPLTAIQSGFTIARHPQMIFRKSVKSKSPKTEARQHFQARVVSSRLTKEPLPPICKCSLPEGPAKPVGGGVKKQYYSSHGSCLFLFSVCVSSCCVCHRLCFLVCHVCCSFLFASLFLSSLFFFASFPYLSMYRSSIRVSVYL